LSLKGRTFTHFIPVGFLGPAVKSIYWLSWFAQCTIGQSDEFCGTSDGQPPATEPLRTLRQRLPGCSETPETLWSGPGGCRTRGWGSFEPAGSCCPGWPRMMPRAHWSMAFPQNRLSGERALTGKPHAGRRRLSSA
jgi:hypothetical protein